MVLDRTEEPEVPLRERGYLPEVFSVSERAALPERRGCGVLAVSDLSVTYTERSTTSSSCTMK